MLFAATTLQPDNSITFTATVVIAGLGTVLAALALLIVIFNAFGKLVSKSEARAKKKKAKKLLEEVQPENVYPDISEMELFDPLLEEEQSGIAPEIVAAISAAVYMYEGENAVITSIRRKKRQAATRSVWAQAAVMDNTRPL